MSTIVVETVVPVLTCGRCGAATTHGQRFCTDCGVLIGRTVGSVEFDPFRGVVPASAGAVAAARGLDVLVCLIAAALGAGLFLLAHTAVPRSDAVGTSIAGAVLGFVVTAVAVVIRASRTGRGPGGLVMATRVVDGDDALACGPAAAVGRLRGRHRPRGGGPWARATGTVTASLRAGRDPLSPALDQLGMTYGAAAAAGVRPHTPTPTGGPVPVGLDATRLAGGPVPSVPTSGVDADPVPLDATVLTFDTGAVHWFRTTCVVGRNPEAEAGVTTIAVPDLSRTLSKTHTALVQENGVVRIRDLASTNGTTVVHTDGSFDDLVPGADVVLEPGATVRIGDHAFRLDRVGGAA
ncbi:FHA domain-containing protein [Curtobacterium sp. PhB136]|uniref:FHA domain-containing protein n=1 Tax=Curtobacterium sp. PhB136 TaxID=2485181 RepID=UPI00104763CB|nr:FHA domain-containing protein [Curtobacterium sp. PhB136]TCK59658.1 FHA domain-containing protein [Curtobacterium sp. PhB136]